MEDESIKEKVIKAISLYEYSACDEDELSFQAEQIITILEKDVQGWWKGELDSKVGIFPYNYVKVLSSEEYNLRMAALNAAAAISSMTVKDKSQRRSVSQSPSGSSLKSLFSSAEEHELGEEFQVPISKQTDSTEVYNPILRNYPEEMAGFAKILKEGNLSKKGHLRRNWKSRWFVLRLGSLSYYKEKGEGKPQGTLILHKDCFIEVENGLNRKGGDRKNCFKITDKSQKVLAANKKPFIFILDASSPKDREEWMEALNKSKTS